jgi:hypothetical protein
VDLLRVMLHNPLRLNHKYNRVNHKYNRVNHKYNRVNPQKPQQWLLWENVDLGGFSPDLVRL